MYLGDPAIPRTVLAGYRSVRDLDGPLLWPEAFLCAAALSNLAFQVTIPRERVSVHFARNVREFATVFCDGLAAERSFVLR